MLLAKLGTDFTTGIREFLTVHGSNLDLDEEEDFHEFRSIRDNRSQSTKMVQNVIYLSVMVVYGFIAW